MTSMSTKVIHPQLLTMQWRPRGTAWQTRNGAWAAADASSSSSSQDAAAASDPSSACASPHRCRPVQLLLDLLQAGALLEARHPIDHSWGHVRAGAGGSSVGVDGKDVAGAAEGANGQPATVQAKAHVLDLRKDVKGWKSQRERETFSSMSWLEMNKSQIITKTFSCFGQELTTQVFSDWAFIYLFCRQVSPVCAATFCLIQDFYAPTFLCQLKNLRLISLKKEACQKSVFFLSILIRKKDGKPTNTKSYI